MEESMKKVELIRHRDRVRTHLVVWIVLVICLRILASFHLLVFLMNVVWLAVAYCALLIILWCYFELRILRTAD
jgi:hypothetical protein